MSARCEPPEELWNKDGFHWVEAPDGKLRIWRWLCRDGATTRGWPMSAAGYRYLAPVATPAEVARCKPPIAPDYVDALVAEVAALRAEVERLRGALEAAANGLDEVAVRTWDKRRPDECRRACDEASELATGYRDEARAALTHKEPGNEG